MDTLDPPLPPGFRRRRRGSQQGPTYYPLLTSSLAVILLAVLVVYVSNVAEEEFRVQGFSDYGSYRYAAVTSDTDACSAIAVDIMAKKRGSAVDAAIASMICSSIHNPQSTGFGGGFFAVIYERPRNSSQRVMMTLDARETAPAATARNMFVNNTMTNSGGQYIAIPGELRGYYEAWQKFGRASWAELFAPAIELCQKGVAVRPALAAYISLYEDEIKASPTMRRAFLKADGRKLKGGDMLQNPAMLNTLKVLASEGVNAFYNGSLTYQILQEVKKSGGAITAQDLLNYRAEWREPLVTTLKDRNLTLYGVPPPSSGVIIQFMLSMISGFNMSGRYDLSEDQVTLMYHQIIETMKFGYAKASFLGDPGFADISAVMENLTSTDFIEYVRSQISLERTHEPQHYGPTYWAVRNGSSSHLSIYSADGSAVSFTSSINGVFGSFVRGEDTGIIYNNAMVDFTTLPLEGADVDGLSPSPNNMAAPGKRPLSPMGPTIALDDAGEVFGLYGGAGGSRTPAATFYVMVQDIFLKERIDFAVNHPRLHHSHFPNVVEHEDGFPKFLLEHLSAKGHTLQAAQDRSQFTFEPAIRNYCAACNDCPHFTDKQSCLIASSDFRQAGSPDGF